MAINTETQREALNDLQQQALSWWEAHRPESYSLRQHLDNPVVNTCSSAEAALAEAVGAAVKVGAI